MNLYKELQEKLSEHNPTEVDELILDDIFENITHFSESNKKDLEKYTNLIHLSLNGFGLESLKNFPSIQSLQVLELRGNKLDGSDFKSIHSLFPELYKLKVGDNPIKSIDVFKVLKDSNIKKLELQGTKVAEKDGYRADLFKIISGLETIDNQTKEGDDVSTTNYDEGDEDELDDEDMEGDEEFDEEDEFDEDDDDEDADEESEKPKKKK